MSLENLLKTGQLKPHQTDRKEIGRLLVAARRNLADARAYNISTENRFDAGYKCIMQCALMALMGNRSRFACKLHRRSRTAHGRSFGVVGRNSSGVDAVSAYRTWRWS